MKPTSSSNDPHQPSAGHGAHDHLHHDDVAHEASDINIRAVIMSTVAIALVCLVTAGLMYLLMVNVLEPMAQARDPKPSPLAMPATDMPPTTLTTPTFGSAPDPKLLTNEPRMLGEVRAGWEKDLHGFGSTDQSGAGRIPLEAAKQILIDKSGLAVRAEPLTDPRVGTHAPAYGEASSGRTITTPVTTERAAPAAASDADHKPAAGGHK
jgi:hypothetical protein